MTPTEVSILLEYLNGAYPWSRIEELTTDVWSVHFADVDPVDATAAAHRWVGGNDRPPSINQLLTMCREEARAARLAETPRAPMLDDGTVLEPDPGQRATFIGALRAALDVARRGGGPDAAVAEFARHAPAPDGRRITYPCRCREGQGWLLEDSGVVSPCPSCRPELHERWLGGHLAPKHVCAECRRRAG